MWLHDPEMEQHPDAVWKQDGQGGELPGGLVPTFQKPSDLCPHTLHATHIHGRARDGV